MYNTPLAIANLFTIWVYWRVSAGFVLEQSLAVVCAKLWSKGMWSMPDACIADGLFVEHCISAGTSQLYLFASPDFVMISSSAKQCFERRSCCYGKIDVIVDAKKHLRLIPASSKLSIGNAFPVYLQWVSHTARTGQSCVCSII